MYTTVAIIAVARIEDIDKTAAVLRALERKCDQIRSIEVGVHGPRVDRSAHIAFIARFADRAAFEAFEAHPEWAKTRQFLDRSRARLVRVDFAA